ncbi:BRCT domain-containing protein [Tirmania nivea]|nr:BRCT domain-containing protein [Tirmania nivea]
MKAKLWVVIGFPENKRPVPAGSEWESKLVDTNGHRTVLLKEKKKGAKLGTSTQSVPVARKRDDIEEGTVGESVEVPITKIYVVKSLWPQFKERLYSFEVGSPEGVDSPTSRLSVVPTAETPPLKDRRASPLFPPGANSSKLLLSGIPSGANTKKVLDGVFSGMIFAISYGENEFEKKGVTAKILANGGRILEQGFDEMFKPIPGAKSKSITAASITTSIASDTEKEGEVGFACVIADKYSRRVKFLQALALGIPCLAGRWVEDCIKKNMVVDWEMYLLPAGESAYLSGAIRSRILPPFSAATSKFLGIVEQRRKLLDGYNVLLVMGKGKVGEKRRPYRFLVWAMGARIVRGVVSVEEANAVLREGVNGPVGVQDSGIDGVVGAELACQRWDLVYLDSGSGRVGKEKLWTGVPKGWGRPRIVDDEWVVQSLILGRLLTE